MPRSKSPGDKHGDTTHDTKGPRTERGGDRATPGSGEDDGGLADLQPEDVEGSDPAR